VSEATIEIFDEESEASGGLKREIRWTHAVWVASGAPALVLFSIGGIAATVGSPSWLCWIVSVLIGSIQMFTYAEVCSMFSHKSGGTAIAGSMAWLKYGKIFPAISAWTYWLGWTPVIAIGTSLASGYVLSALFPATSVVNTWNLVLVNLPFGIALQVNATFFLSCFLMLVCFVIQSKGILSIARVQMVFAISSLLPLGLVALVPLITGDLPSAHFAPFVPLTHDLKGNVIPGHWDAAGWTLFGAGVFLAGWSTYGLETALVYTREFTNPRKDTIKAAIGISLVCLFFYSLVPLSFQGFLGLAGLLDPGILSGSGVGLAMAHMVGFTGWAVNIVIIMLVATLLLSVMAAIAGSARTLYQSSKDGFLPKYLSQTNEKATPTRAMWTDLSVNVFLLMMNNDLYILALSNVAYMTFIYMNLQSGWMHRMDRPDWTRSYKAPSLLLGLGAVCGFVDMFVIGVGSNSYGKGVLIGGFTVVFLSVPIFLYRHYITDKGKFPDDFAADIQPGGTVTAATTRAGYLPYLAVAGAVAAVAIGSYIAVY